MRARLAHVGGSVETAVVDFLFLLIIAFLGVGVLAQSLAPKEADLQGSKDREKAERVVAEQQRSLEELQLEHERLQEELKRLLADLPKAVEQRKAQEEIDRLRQAIANTRQRLSKVAEVIASLTAEVSKLREQVDASAKREQELKAVEADLKGRDAELRRLEKAKTEQLQKLAELQAQLVRPAQEKYPVTSGTPIVRRDRVARETYSVMLSGGKVIPLAPPFYKAERRQGGAVVVSPVQPGLTLQEALKPDSPLMKEVTTAAFRKDGQVSMLVTSDSFATFRALRENLARQGIDYGWDPVESTRLVISENGRRTPIQR